MPSVTTARITEHNRGSAAVIPMRGKQQEAVVVDSAVMKLALRQTVTLPLWPPQHISHVTPTYKAEYIFSFYKHLSAHLPASLLLEQYLCFHLKL